ncbi:putative O-acetyl transferase [Ceratobasidium sp. 370]|nr:putative O-acetyl transferase [Ceratobasidium sp. 370]
MADQDRAEFDLMISGGSYLASDPYIQAIAKAQRAKLNEINAEKDTVRRSDLLHSFLNVNKDAEIDIWMPFFCEYEMMCLSARGAPSWTFAQASRAALQDISHEKTNILLVTIGERTLIGPNVQIYTPLHPLRPEERNGTKGRESGKPITIGKDCWIGGAVVICPGVTIGDGSTVGAGSVVTRDVESRCFVAGNPAKLIKRID